MDDESGLSKQKFSEVERFERLKIAAWVEDGMEIKNSSANLLVYRLFWLNIDRNFFKLSYHTLTIAQLNFN